MFHMRIKLYQFGSKQRNTNIIIGRRILEHLKVYLSYQGKSFREDIFIL